MVLRELEALGMFCIIYVPMVHAGRRIRVGEGCIQLHVAYTDHVNASQGIVVFYGEPRPDFSSLRKPPRVMLSTDKRRPRYLQHHLPKLYSTSFFSVPRLHFVNPSTIDILELR